MTLHMLFILDCFWSPFVNSNIFVNFANTMLVTMHIFFLLSFSFGPKMCMKAHAICSYFGIVKVSHQILFS